MYVCIDVLPKWRQTKTSGWKNSVDYDDVSQTVKVNKLFSLKRFKFNMITYIVWNAQTMTNSADRYRQLIYILSEGALTLVLADSA